MPEQHAEEVAELAGAIARELALPEDVVLRCRLGGWLHDIGKVAIPDRILVKPGALDEDEWRIMRTHAEIGEQLVRRIEALGTAALAVRHHHEHVDGSGYPDGLAGDAIPIEARVVAVADAFSAITADRPYRRARTRGRGARGAARTAPGGITTRGSSRRSPGCSQPLRFPSSRPRSRLASDARSRFGRAVQARDRPAPAVRVQLRERERRGVDAPEREHGRAERVHDRGLDHLAVRDRDDAPVPLGLRVEPARDAGAEDAPGSRRRAGPPRDRASSRGRRPGRRR